MSQRIAIIGAGPAGLTAAWQLRAHGYESVRIFEKNDRVGGKCLTPTIDGRNYELGAVIVGRTTYEVINTLIAEFDLSCSPLRKTTLLDSSRGGRVNGALLVRDFLLRYRPALQRFFAAAHPIPAFSQPGYLGFDVAEFGCTLADWARREGLEDLLELLAPIYTGFGYGYLDQVSAPQFFKIYDAERLRKSFTLQLTLQPSMLTIDVGFQGLWERVAAQQDVVLSSDVRRIERGETVRITTQDGTEDFDAVILACPLHRIRHALDLSPAEEARYAKIRVIDYQTITAEVDGLGPRGLVFMVDNMKAERAGHLVCGYRRHHDSNIWALYPLSNGAIADDEIIETARADLSAVGARLGRIHRHDKWDFYPHVSPEDFAAGFYADIEASQGDNNTYIAGEIVSAATVESAANYSCELIKRFFPSLR